MKKYIINSAPLLPLALMLMVGIGLGFACHAEALWLYGAFACTVLLAALSGRWAKVQNSAIMLSAVLLGSMLANGRQSAAERFSFDGEERQMELVVISEPSEKAKTIAFDVLQAKDGRKLKCYVQKDARSQTLMPGDGLIVRSAIQENADHREGRFDYAQYLTRQGFSGRCYVRADGWQRHTVRLDGLSLVQRSRITFLRWRHYLLQKLRLPSASSADYAVLAAMTLGDKSALSRGLRDTYSVTGASHVLALSGLHLGILYFFLSMILPGRSRRGILSQSLLVLAIWAFAFLVGLPVSVVRSALMFSLFAIFSLGGRSGASVNTLSFAAIVILVANPYSLFDVGFQLSFMAVLSILLLMPLMDAWVTPIWRQRHWLLGRLWGCVAVSTAAQLGVAPLLAFYFGRFSTYFLLTNLVVLPCVYLILLGSLLMLLMPWPPLAACVMLTVGGLNRFLEQLARLPLASIEGLQPTVAQVVLCYVAIAALYAALLRLNNLWPRMD